MLADQEAMMVARTPLQGGGEVLARAGELGMTELRQAPRIALATIAFRMRRPLKPRISEMTDASLILASSSVA